MAMTTRVLFRMNLGTPWFQASDKEKQEGWERWGQVTDEWKNDPGNRFICYYASYGARVDGYSHNYVFEVDDIAKAHAIADGVQKTNAVPERFSIDIVWGNTDNDQYWNS